MAGERTGDAHLQRGQAHPDVASVGEEGQAAVVEGHGHLQTGTGGGAHARGGLGWGKGESHTGGHGMCTVGAEDWPLPTLQLLYLHPWPEKGQMSLLPLTRERWGWRTARGVGKELPESAGSYLIRGDLLSNQRGSCIMLRTEGGSLKPLNIPPSIQVLLSNFVYQRIRKSAGQHRLNLARGQRRGITAPERNPPDGTTHNPACSHVHRG